MSEKLLTAHMYTYKGNQIFPEQNAAISQILPLHFAVGSQIALLYVNISH
jgi:hypothetical protein